jgi:hypothetical protein
MTLLRLIQRASILAGMTFASLAVHGNPVHAEDSLYCVTASNGKTECGTLKVVERACITTATGSTVCGKYKPVTESQRQEASKPVPSIVARREIDNFVLTLESCKRVDENVRCQLNILNKGKERRVSLYASNSSLVDPNGKSYGNAYADFGNGSNSYPSATVTPNTDIIISIVFSNIPDSTVKIQLLNLAFQSGIKPVQFRNIPISN